MKKSVEPNILLKLERSLPLTDAEFGRLAKSLFNAMILLEVELNDIKKQLSVSGPRLDSADKGVDSAKPVRPKQDK
jgi:hypothetical protein